MKRTHEVNVHRSSTAKDDDGRQYDDWTDPGEVASDVGANLQPQSGMVRRTEGGREVQVDYRGFVPAGTDVEVGDGIEVVDGVGPDRLKVVFVGRQGGKWDVELDLVLSDEDFGS